MKKEEAKYLEKFHGFEKVKVDHQHLRRLLNPMPTPKWKWEVISLDIMIGFPRNIGKHEAIMVMVDKLTKDTDFISIHSTYKVIDVVKFFIQEIF